MIWIVMSAAAVLVALPLAAAALIGHVADFVAASGPGTTGSENPSGYDYGQQD